MIRTKNITYNIYLPLLVVFSICFPLSSFAESCENYPNKSGINYMESNGKFKIISSTEVAVEFDDQETYLDARQAAEDSAIVNISRFIKLMTNASTKDKTEPLKIRVNGLEKNKINRKLKRTFKSYNFQTSSILRGVTMTDNCYVPGELVKVSVEVSSDSIRAAEKVESEMKRSLSKEENPYK
tara:strand:+ start:143 stop:691 length:549 start_codon:yes stop_codon:yes gene_type:complete